MPTNQRAEPSRALHLLPIRLSQRRLFQGCAILLLFPTAAAFLPVQGRAPSRTIALIPVTVPMPASAPLPIARAALSQPAHRMPSRFPRLSGLASWYGSVLAGHRTASGERFDPAALTACHLTLPFGTLVKVVNLRNHRSVTVRINDRGILTPSRVIDLSAAAAEQLDMLRTGVAPVRLEIQKALDLKPEPPPSANAPLPAPTS